MKIGLAASSRTTTGPRKPALSTLTAVRYFEPRVFLTMPTEGTSKYPPLAIRPNQQLPRPPDRAGRGVRTRCHTAEDWQAMYPHIARLYIQQGRRLREVMVVMQEEYGFKAT